MSSPNILVVPYEKTSSRLGTVAAARVISGLLRCKFPEVPLLELDADRLEVPDLVAAQRSALERCGSPKLLVGGNHLISYAAMLEYVEGGGKQIVVFDAHHDAYIYSQLTHYSHLYHLVRSHDVQVNVLGCRYEPERADPRVRLVAVDQWFPFLRELEAPFYLSVDLDVLDPDEFSAVNHPVADGVPFDQLLSAIDLALDRDPPYVDLVEASFAAACAPVAIERLTVLLERLVAYSSRRAAGMARTSPVDPTGTSCTADRVVPGGTSETI